MSFDLQLADSLSASKRVDAAVLEVVERSAEVMVESAAGAEGLGQPLEVCLRITDDAEIRNLNRDYRARDAATDVLAFALREAPGGEAAPHLLGDVVISVETAERQRGDRTLAGELVFLFAHGLCHLLGYDHQDDREEADMDARVSELRAATATIWDVR